MSAFESGLSTAVTQSPLWADIVAKVPKCVRLFFRQKTKQAKIAN
jgi:hypothetical protein